MAKKKPPSVPNPVKEALLVYEKIVGSKAKANILSNQYTDDEIMLFVHEIQTQKEALDTDNPQDVSQIEQLARVTIQLNRLLTFQRDLFNEANELSELAEEAGPEMLHEANKKKDQAIKISGELRELHTIRRDILKQLSVTREQRLKISNESKITLSNIINQLRDHFTKNQIGIYGEVLKKSTNKKHKTMIEDGLIIVSQPKDVTNEVVTQEQSVGQQEEGVQESQVQPPQETPEHT